MVKLDALTLRINGRECEKVMFRYAMVDGYPGGDIEIVVPDSQFGDMVLNDNFLIEVQQTGVTKWRRTRVRELVRLILREKRASR